jgi:hypothetical protein
MTARHGAWIALTGSGVAWSAHLFAGYFLVALGCPRGWPLGSMLAGATAVAAAAALGIGVGAARAWRRSGPAPNDDHVTRLLFGAAALLAGLFTLAIVVSASTALVLSPCRAVAIGG